MHEALALILSTAKKIKEKKKKGKGAERKGEMALLPQLYTACQGSLSKGETQRSPSTFTVWSRQIQGVGPRQLTLHTQQDPDSSGLCRHY